jgi:hypothetical protein
LSGAGCRCMPPNGRNAADRILWKRHRRRPRKEDSRERQIRRRPFSHTLSKIVNIQDRTSSAFADASPWLLMPGYRSPGAVLPQLARRKASEHSCRGRRGIATGTPQNAAGNSSSRRGHGSNRRNSCSTFHRLRGNTTPPPGVELSSKRIANQFT